MFISDLFLKCDIVALFFIALRSCYFHLHAAVSGDQFPEFLVSQLIIFTPPWIGLKAIIIQSISPQESTSQTGLYQGSKVKELVNQNQEPGYYSIKFDGNSLASGVYFYRIVVRSTGNSYIETKKMLLIK
jgi:hypothetical protein